MAEPVEAALDDAVLRLLRGTDLDGLLASVIEVGMPGIGEGAVALYRLHDDGWIRLAGAVGFARAVHERYSLFASGADLPVAQAVREHRPVYSIAGDFPRSAADDVGRRTRASAEYAAFPLLLDGRCLGALSFRLAGGSSLDETLHRSMTRAAALCAHRLEHIERLLGKNPGSPAPAVPTPSPVPSASPAATPALPAHAQSRTPAFRGSSGDSGAPERREPWPKKGPGRFRPSESPVGRARGSMLDMAMSNANIGTFDWEFATGRLIWDERLCRLFGMRPEDFDGRIETYFDALHPGDRALVDAAVEESHRTGKFHAAFRVRHPDGEIRWIDAESRVLYGSDGVPFGMVGVAQDRTEEREREADRRARQDFIVTVTQGFTAALSTGEVIRTMAETVLPGLGARWLAVYVREGDGRFRLIGSRGFEPSVVEGLHRAGVIFASPPALAALGLCDPIFAESPEEYRDLLPGEQLTPLPGQGAWALLPLATADGLVGTCVIIYDRPRSFSSDDRLFCTAVSGMLAQSLARARLLEERRGQLTDLQRMMLPHRVPPLPGLEIAVRYQPGSAGLDVGGDWYDVLPMPDDRVALVIGDVQGHSARAAAVMGQLRTAMRTQAEDGHSLGDLLCRGNRTLFDLDTDLFATCCIVEIARDSGVTRMVRAGHPYPLLLERDGKVRELVAPGGMPLGCFLDDEYPVSEFTLPEGATLLLLTDGLVERPGKDYGESVVDIAEQLAWWAGTADVTDGPVRGDRRDLDVIADRIVTPAVSRPSHDDVAVLLVRRTAVTADV